MFKFISINFINQFKFIALYYKVLHIMESWLKRSISEASASDSQGPLNKNAKI